MTCRRSLKQRRPSRSAESGECWRSSASAAGKLAQIMIICQNRVCVWVSGRRARAAMPRLKFAACRGRPMAVCSKKLGTRRILCLSVFLTFLLSSSCSPPSRFVTLANKDVNQAGRTKLDRERLRSCMREMVRGRVCRGSRFGFFESEPSTRRSPDAMKLVF